MADEQASTVFCLTCKKLVSFVEADVKEREQRSQCDCFVDDGDVEAGQGQHATRCGVFNPPQIVDFIVCPSCREQIPLGLPRFRSQPGPGAT